VSGSWRKLTEEKTVRENMTATFRSGWLKTDEKGRSFMAEIGVSLLTSFAVT
jgi:ribulose kinase